MKLPHVWARKFNFSLVAPNFKSLANHRATTAVYLLFVCLFLILSVVGKDLLLLLPIVPGSILYLRLIMFGFHKKNPSEKQKKGVQKKFQLDTKRNERKREVQRFVFTFVAALPIPVILLTIVSVFFLHQVANTFPLGYWLALFNWVVNNIFPVSVFVVLSALVPFVLKRLLSKSKHSRNFTHNRLATLFALAISPVFAFVLVYIIAVGHANAIFLLARISPVSVGIVTDKDQILEKIKTSNELPNFANGSTGMTDALLDDALSETGKFYIQIVKTLPSWTTIKTPAIITDVYLIKNTVLVNKINEDFFEKAAPAIGRKIVSNYSTDRPIREGPDLQLISRQDYLRYRDERIDEEIEKLQTLKNAVDQQMRSIRAEIGKANNAIIEIDSTIRQNIESRDQWYNYCKTATTTRIDWSSYSLYTIRLYTDDECERQRNEYDQVNNTLGTQRGEWAGYLASLKREQSGLEEVWSYYQDLQDVVAASKNSTPYELGLFEPEKNIKVVLDSTKNEDLADFLSTVVHEYYHYASYVSEDRQLPLFFEEGFTEYFSRKAVASAVKVETELGYPIITNIIGQIISDISEEKIAEIYFTKNTELLASTLDEYYGKDFYSDSEYYFYILPFLNGEDAIKVSNNIIFRIDGEQVTEEDLYSKKTDF